MTRPRDKQSEAAPEDPKAEELGGSGEERNRHLRYAHEQYSGSGQGRLGAPKGRNLPLDKPRRKQERYPPGTRMPWPADEAIASEDKGSKPRK